MRTHEAITAFLDSKQDLSPRTLEQYSAGLTYLERHCPDIPSDPQPLRAALHSVAHVWVRDSCWHVWRLFFRWWWDEQDCKAPNPMQRVKRSRPPEVEMRVLEPPELARVVAAAPSARDKAVVALALDCGVRASEFRPLRPADIGDDTISVLGKGNKRLRVPLSPETRQLLQPLLDQSRKTGSDAPLFLGDKGGPLSRFRVYDIVRYCMDQAGVAGPKRGPHCLRHSLGTNFIASGGDPFTLQRIMRHRNIATTQKYVHLAMHTIVEKHNLFSPARQALLGAQGVLITHEALEEADAILREEKSR